MHIVFFVLLIGIASFLTYKASRERRNADKLFATGIKAEGVVIGHQLRLYKGSYRETDYPIIQFTTATGQVVEVAKMNQLPLLHKFETIPIFYEVTNPQNIVFESEPGSALPYVLPSLLWMMVTVILLATILGK
jgi:hypothetical protein